MNYINRRPPEGINTTSTPWIADFVLLLVGFFAAMAFALWLLLNLLSYTITWVPVTWEQALADPLMQKTEQHVDQPYLQQLAEVLAAAGGMDSTVPIQLQVSSSATANAYATLGGHMVLMDGLYEVVESEQGLAFIIAHELAHLHYRHPIKGLTQQLGMMSFFGLVFGSSDLSPLIGTSGQLLQLTYSREYEFQADAWALQAMAQYYGHVQGYDEFFLWVKSARPSTIPDWISTHPSTESRIQRLEQQIQIQGYTTDGTLIPLTLCVSDEMAIVSRTHRCR